jgi:hypothetical protein
MTLLLDEVCEPVEAGWLSWDNLRSFVFENPVRFHTDANPGFFRGTIIEDEVSRFIGGEPVHAESGSS